MVFQSDCASFTNRVEMGLKMGADIRNDPFEILPD